MKFSGYSIVSNPVYVLITGLLGVLITFTMFLYRYPEPLDIVGQAIVSKPEFLMWVFFHAVLSCILAISLYPMWGILVSFYRNQT